MTGEQEKPQKLVHHRGTETRREAKSKPEGTEVAEHTEIWLPAGRLDENAVTIYV